MIYLSILYLCSSHQKSSILHTQKSGKMFYIERKIAMIRNPYNPVPHDTPDIIRKCDKNTS